MIWDIIISIGNYVIDALATLGKLVLLLLPKSPFQFIDNSPISSYLGLLNWIIPVDALISIGTTWLFAVAIYYGVQTVLRWVKSIE